MSLKDILFQTHDGKLHLFPEWLNDWDVEFKLRAPKRTTVSGKLINGKLIDLEIMPEYRVYETNERAKFYPGSRGCCFDYHCNSILI